MTLAMPVRHPEYPDRVLLRAGYALDDAAIGRLREIELRELWIRYPSLQFIAERINPEATRLRAELAVSLDKALSGVADNASLDLDYPQFKQTVHDLIDRLVEQPTSALYMDELCGGGKRYLNHSSNVCLLSLLMGLRLETYLVQQRRRLPPHLARDVVALGIGAMLHDVGMLRLDAETRERWERTHDETDEAWREHVLLGFEMVRDKIGPSASAVVLHHHQRFDGTGFPARDNHLGELEAPVGERIHIFARIVAAADLYDRLRNPGEGAEPRTAVHALRLMQDPRLLRRLDPMVFKALVTVAPPYPPGTIVELTDGRTGVVTDCTPANPCRPTVQVLSDPLRNFDKPNVDGEPLDLRKHPDLQVARADDRRVLEKNFYPKPGTSVYDVDVAQLNQWNAAAA